jgi:hypothetical protein
MRAFMRRLLAAGLLCFAAVPGAPAAGSNAEPGVPAAAAREAFERIKALSGRWRGGSTKGWTDEVRIRPIAGGSAVVEDGGGSPAGENGAHPGEEMMTVFYLDGDRLMLTHYCVARNHPRLVASAIADGGRSLRFRFVDGANLESRDRGHMDSVVMRIDGPDRFTSRWTWFDHGRSKWTEAIERVRVTDAR